MKKKNLLLLFFCFSLMISNNVNAQLLKKLKDKVDKAVNGKDNSNTSNNESTKTNNQSKNTSTSNETNVPVIDFEKYHIITQPMISEADIKESVHIFMNQYSYYEIKDNTIVGKVVMIAGDKENEAGGLEGNTAGYIFENGKMVQRTATAEIDRQKKSFEQEYQYWDYPYTASDNDNLMGKVVEYSFGQNGQQAYINFNGKKFGPYVAVMGFMMNKAKTKFFAVVNTIGNSDPVYYLISSGGEKIKLPSLGNLMVNADFSKAAAYGFAPSALSENSDETLKSLADNLHNSDIYYSDGSVIKKATGIAMAGNAWLDLSGKNNLSADLNYGAYINGKKIIDKDVRAGELWCNAAASQWCYYNYHDGHLVFSDGTDVSGIFHPQQLPLGGKTYIVWFQYNKGWQNGDLLLCKKEL